MNDYTPVLGDLGMIHTVSMAKKIGFSGGTPLYMGYMVHKGKMRLYLDDCKADIFALGVTFYQIMKGRAPSYVNNAAA